MKLEDAQTVTQRKEFAPAVFVTRRNKQRRKERVLRVIYLFILKSHKRYVTNISFSQKISI